MRLAALFLFFTFAALAADPTARVVTIKGSGGNYTSLAAAEDGEDNTGDLVSRNETITFECYASAAPDTTTVTVSGWTTGPNNRIKITVPINERHSGTLNLSKYHIAVADARGIRISEEYVTLEGLQVVRTSTSANYQACVDFGALGLENDVRINDGIFKQAGNASYYEPAIYANGETISFKAWNCVCYGSSSAASDNGAAIRLQTVSNAWVYSSTVIGASRGISAGTIKGTMTLKNVYARGTSAAYVGTFTTANCASSDTTADGTALDNIALSTANFVNVTSGSEDFHLVVGSALINVGTDTSGDSAPLNFTTDIDGQTRSGTWDIGADEYVATSTAEPAPRRKMIIGW